MLVDTDRIVGMHRMLCPNGTVKPFLVSLVEPVAYLKSESLQLRVLSLSSDEDGNVGVGVFPEREEFLIGGLGLSGVALHGIGAS